MSIKYSACRRGTPKISMLVAEVIVRFISGWFFRIMLPLELLYFSLLLSAFWRWVSAWPHSPPPDYNRSRALSKRQIASKVLTACVFAERDTFGTVYDYDRSQVAVAMATEYSNDYIVPPDYRVHVLYRDIGQICSGKNHVVGHAMSLLQEGVKCDVFIGPGTPKVSVSPFGRSFER